MLSENDVVGQFTGLGRETLRIWIKRGWVTPDQMGTRYQFREIDIARVGLIHEFSRDLALDDDTLDLVLPLLDQVHGLRNQLRRLARAVNAQPDAVRRQIARDLAVSDAKQPGEGES